MNNLKEFDFATTPIVDIVNDIIIDAVLKNASDIHFDPAENYLRIRIRIDGDLQDYSIIQNKYKRNLITRVKLLAGMNITESRLPQDGAIKSTIEGKDLDLRVSSLPTSFGEKVVIRILDYSMSFKGIEALGFTKENYKVIEKMLANPNGIILVTGATGSGKSTTVYSMLQKLNKEETNIITVEDPVEMNIEGINQIQVNQEIGLDFATVLRSILRQDPNIILIGEIRDSETAKIAIRASITGHLVLSTLHTNSSLTTIERLLDMDVERYLLSASLKGIVSQNLAKRLCPKCRKKRPTNELEKRIFRKALHKEVNEVYEAVGCKDCRHGYRGRIAIQEVLLINDKIRDAINNAIPRDELRKLIYTDNVKTLFQDGLLKVIEGITTFDEVFRIIDVEDDPSNIYGNDDEEINEEINKELEKNDETNKDSEVLVIDDNEVPLLGDVKKESIVIKDKEEPKKEVIKDEYITPKHELKEEINKPQVEAKEINNVTPITPVIPKQEEIKVIKEEPKTDDNDNKNDLFASIFNSKNIYKDEVDEDYETNEFIEPNIINNKNDHFASYEKEVIKDNPFLKRFKPEEKKEEPKKSYTDTLIELINKDLF